MVCKTYWRRNGFVSIWLTVQFFIATLKLLHLGRFRRSWSSVYLNSFFEKEGSNDNFFGLDTMDELDLFQKLMNIKDQHLKVSLHDDIIVGSSFINYEI